MRSGKFPCGGPEAVLGFTVGQVRRDGYVVVSVETKDFESEVLRLAGASHPGGEGTHTFTVSGLKQEARLVLEATSQEPVRIAIHPPRRLTLPPGAPQDPSSGDRPK